ncbi:hypothetical protein BDR26DRAFT_852905 [Obelidium mucronatum]|nr:hypothetical protein BDR26DRAFT_852905 [Obelidium mucronatum]
MAFGLKKQSKISMKEEQPPPYPDSSPENRTWLQLLYFCRSTQDPNIIQVFDSPSTKTEAIATIDNWHQTPASFAAYRDVTQSYVGSSPGSRVTDTRHNPPTQFSSEFILPAKNSGPELWHHFVKGGGSGLSQPNDSWHSFKVVTPPSETSPATAFFPQTYSVSLGSIAFTNFHVGQQHTAVLVETSDTTQIKSRKLPPEHVQAGLLESFFCRCGSGC